MEIKNSREQQEQQTSKANANQTENDSFSPVQQFKDNRPESLATAQLISSIQNNVQDNSTPFVDNRPEAIVQQKQQALMNNNQAPLQLKRLRKDLTGLGSGAAGQWHDGDDKFHVTVYPDDASHIVSRGFKFVSPDFTSEFHVTNHNSGKFGRRFYNIDNGSKVGTDQGSIDGHDDLATKFLSTLSDKKIYTDEEAQEYANEKKKLEEEAASSEVGTIERIVKEVAEKHSGKTINYEHPSFFKILGEINRALKEERIEGKKSDTLTALFKQHHKGAEYV